MDKLRINRSYQSSHPSNCPLIEKTADGQEVGVCCFFMPDGITCPRHGDTRKHEPVAAAPSHFFEVARLLKPEIDETEPVPTGNETVDCISRTMWEHRHDPMIVIPNHWPRNLGGVEPAFALSMWASDRIETDPRGEDDSYILELFDERWTLLMPVRIARKALKKLVAGGFVEVVSKNLAGVKDALAIKFNWERIAGAASMPMPATNG